MRTVTNRLLAAACVSWLCCVLAMAQLEELGLMPWSLFTSCKFRRTLNRAICCSDLHCPSHACCQLYFVFGGVSAHGKCVPRDPETKLCSRRRTCHGLSDCGREECCRLAWKSRQGVCQRLGEGGDVCTTRPVYVRRLPVVCPCDQHHHCVSSAYSVKGRCVSSTTLPPPTTTLSSTTTTRVTTTMTTVATTRRSTTTTLAPITTTLEASTTTTAATTPAAAATTPAQTLAPTPETCALCPPDTQFFCCLNGSCLIRPVRGQGCGSGSCDCRDSVCSHPISGVCQ